MSPEETWLIDIDMDASQKNDVIDVQGNLQIDSSKLKVVVIGGELSAGDSFDVINAAAIAGTFSEVSLPELPPSLKWNTSNLNVDGTLVIEEDTAILGDCNVDGTQDAADLACVVNVEQRDAILDALNSLPGDLDGDGSVTFADFITLSTHFNGASTRYSDGNIDLKDGIDFADFVILSTNFGNKRPVGAPTAVLNDPVPTAASDDFFSRHAEELTRVDESLLEGLEDLA